VFLADPSGEGQHDVDLHVDRSGSSISGHIAVYGPRLGWSPRSLLACPANWKDLAHKEHKFQEAENDRLLYVAATRAGTCLIISQREKSANRNPWHAFAADLKDQGDHEDPGPQIAPSKRPVTVTKADVDAARASINERWDALRRATYEMEAIKEVSLKRSRLPAELALPAPVAQEVDQRADREEHPLAGEHGVEWGEDVHALLEAAMRDESAALESLARSLNREREGEGGSDRIDALVSTVRAVQQSAIWKRARASQHLLVEVPLILQVPAGEGGVDLPSVRRGVIDLAFRESEGWVIVDYKTYLVETRLIPKLVDHYRPQVQSYADAWQALVQQPVHEMGLFFTRANRYVRLESEAAARLGEATAGVGKR
jgi:ATP-dependent helicase/nuclease subunit A